MPRGRKRKPSPNAAWAARDIINVVIKDDTLLRAARKRTAVVNAVSAGLHRARNAIVEYIRKYFPKRTGHYQRDVVSQIREGAGEHDPWVLKTGAPDTPYAGYVNAMPPWTGWKGGKLIKKPHVNWTNPDTVPHVQGLSIMFARKQVREHVLAAARKVISYRLYQKVIGVTNA